MPLASTRRTGLVDQVISQLRAQIDSGEWGIGDRIPTESELSEQLEVGRNTVREAVRALAHAGLLEIRQGAGTFVRASSELGGALRRRLERSRVRENLEVRRALEVEAARLAALRHTEEDMADIDRAMALRESTWRDRDMSAFVEADFTFHRAVVNATHNTLLIDLYDDIAQVVYASIAHTAYEKNEEEGAAPTPTGDGIDHSKLTEAIRAADPTAAVREATCYIDELLSLTEE
ncbi:MULTISPECIES: FadR/GntR family transcriptional regulator [Nocardiopsis]|uniref:FadR/GntR family transcriptional regulator n=1 Tax=Nocardiopsis lambiniae TaxID=3075539 RepID=A0ABU2MBB3_9ACTN|nr:MULTISPECIES: FadR/GntR family transcriptional regulator [unclassified Nocardiopsis]MDE3720511.1 FadR/GntR family transcriptional regulator [Nocardiopsis sp. N85]MDT0329973.1 FadR/GntR family transcriptional regulator [Nocardiopsis sp. DSM 44743]